MKKENKKPEAQAGVFSRSQKSKKKLNYKPVETRVSQKKKSRKENLSMISTETKALTVVKKQETRIKRNYTDKKVQESIFKRNSKESLKIIPIGGIEEIGKNMTVFEYGDDIIIVDCGVAFPEDEMLGIDLVIPDFTYLEKNKNKIKGLVITHGHEDHIGSIPYFLKQVNVPIYATKLTCGLIENKLEEHHLVNSTKMKIVAPGQTIVLGRMKVEFIRSNHSIPDSVALAIHTPVGTVIHTGDFKIDYTPIDGSIIDLGRIAELGNKGVLALLSDSTNAERKGFTMSERSVGEVLDKLFMTRKRIIVATFASNVHRVQQIVNSAVENKRKIAVCGRSMINMIETAVRLGYIKAPSNLFIDIDMISNYTDEQLVIITTGSQGEPMSALTRMANGEHKKVTLSQNDLVIISATPIPGNEKFVGKVIDDMMKIGVEVVYSSLMDVHVSGHACQEEQKLMIALAKPKYFIPVHGEYRHLIAHIETAKQLGYTDKNTFIMQNGRVLELNKEDARFSGTVPVGKIMVDGLGVRRRWKYCIKRSSTFIIRWTYHHCFNNGFFIRRSSSWTRCHFKRICLCSRIRKFNG